MTLSGKLPCRLQNEIPQLANRRLLRLSKSDVLFQDWKQVCSCLSTSSYCMCQHIVALQDWWYHLPLNHSWVLIIKIRSCFCQRLANKELMERNQILFIVVHQLCVFYWWLLVFLALIRILVLFFSPRCNLFWQDYRMLLEFLVHSFLDCKFEWSFLIRRCCLV